MDTNVERLIKDYVSAASDKDWDLLARVVRPDATFTGTVKKETRGVAAFVDGFRQLAPISVRHDVRQIVVDGQNAAVLYDFVTDTPAGNVLCSEFLTTDGRQVTSSTLIFDWRMWPQVLQELMRRSSRPQP